MILKAPPIRTGRWSFLCQVKLLFPLRSVALEPPRGPRGSSVMESSPNDADETSWELFPGTPFKTRACCHPGLIELCDFAGDSWGRQVQNGTVARGGCDPEFPIDANGVGWRVRAELPNHKARSQCSFL